MPIYEFKCKSCGQIQEVLVAITAEYPKKCPSCKKEKTLEKIISPSSFVLKGTGWYETDFKKK
ncbi:MAG: FmdB family zinc ribbon protein [Oligoflexales bacterium]